MIKTFFTANEIINNFDFNDIHEYMKKVNWTWAVPYTSELAVPTVDRMKSVVLVIIYDALYKNLSEKTYSVETGGFIAKRYKDGSVSLSFNKKY